MNLGVLKEPRGFIKILQFIFVIAAFATITDYKNEFVVKVQCQVQDSEEVTDATGMPSEGSSPIMFDPQQMKFNGTIKYNYKLDEIKLETNSCFGNGTTERLFLRGHFKSESEFFVFTGVTTMLYSIIALVVYIVLDRMYLHVAMFSIGDLGTHVIFTLFWFAGSSAWANAVVRMKEYMNAEDIQMNNKDLGSVFTLDLESFVPLDMSIVLGFLNTVIYAGNIWFVYKETPFFTSRSTYPPMQ